MLKHLEQRIAQLEALEAIRQLKHRYLNACDLKEVETIRDCFASGPILVDFEAVGRFEDRDSFVAFYASLACQPQVRDSYHGANPEIELLDNEHARGRWALGYFNLDTATGVTRRLRVVYDDAYQCVDGAWKIVQTRSRIVSMVTGHDAPVAA